MTDDDAPRAGLPDAGLPDAGLPDAEDGNALLSRLKVIEDQPLDTRAEHLAQVYDELRAMLEAGDAPPSA